MVRLNKYALLASDERSFFIMYGNKNDIFSKSKYNGTIFLLNTEIDSYYRMELIGYTYIDFHPHGLGIWIEGSKSRLFVINHRREGEFVELFDIDIELKTLTYVRSVTSPILRAINDVVPLSFDSFYVSNWQYYSNDQEPLHTLESLLTMDWTYVCYCNSNSCVIAADKLQMANGLAISADFSTLYVSQSTGSSLIVFSILSDFSLKKRCTFHLNMHPDNLDIANNGDVIITGPIVGITLLLHARYPDSIGVAAEVNRLSIQSLQTCDHQIDILYQTAGEINSDFGLPSSSGSILMSDTNTLYTGAVYANGVFKCKN